MTGCAVLAAEVNGLRVITAEMPWVRSNVAVLQVHAGYADDPPGRAGLAHLTEHVCTSTVARHGVAVGARTDPAGTRYTARDPRIGPLVRAMTLPLAAEPHGADLHAAETAAVLIENARLRDQPQLGLAMAVASRAFAGLDPAVPDTTTEQSLRSVGPDDVLGFRRHRYRPERATLCVAGPAEPADVLDLVAAGISAGTGEATDAVDQLADADVTSRPVPDTTGISDCLVWAACTPVGNTDTELAARSVAIELLVGPAGLLDKAAGRSTGFASLPGRRREVLVVAWPPAGADVVAALRSIAPRPEQVRLARDRVRTRIAFEQQTPGGLAHQLSLHAAGNGAWPSLDIVERLTAEQVLDAAGAILTTATVWRCGDGTLSEYEEDGA